MNNEELKEQIEIYKNERDTYKRLAKSVIKQNNKLEEEIREQKEQKRIAIEYMKQHRLCFRTGTTTLDKDNVLSIETRKLIEILGGVE